MNIVSLALFAIWLPVAPARQDPQRPSWPANDLPQHLESTDLTEVAWAACQVRRDRVRAAVPAVREALARLVGRNEVDGRLARLHLLDTLIQLDVRVPGEDLLPHAIENLRVPALILAAKAPEVNRLYFTARFAALAGSPDREWQVCGNMLTSLREPGFTLTCLQTFRCTLQVEVTDGLGYVTGVG